MRAGAFAESRVIRLINRRFVPFFFNTGGPGLGRDRDANRFVDQFSKKHKRFPNFKMLTDADGNQSNTIAYFAAFQCGESPSLSGVSGGWREEGEARDLEMIYPSKDAVFEFLRKMLRENPEYNHFTKKEQTALDAAKANPSDPQLLVAAAVIHEELGNYQEARELCQRALKQKATHGDLATVHRLLMRMARYQQDWTALKKHAELAARQDKANDLDLAGDIQMELAYWEIKTKQYREAKTRLDKAIAAFPQSTRLGEFHYYSGIASFFLKEKPIAYYHWCWIVENLPDDVMARRAYITAVHEDFPYPNFELDGFKTENPIGNHSIRAAYEAAKKHYQTIAKQKESER